MGRVKAAKRRSAAEGSLEAPHALPYNRMAGATVGTTFSI